MTNEFTKRSESIAPELVEKNVRFIDPRLKLCDETIDKTCEKVYVEDRIIKIEIVNEDHISIDRGDNKTFQD